MSEDGKYQKQNLIGSGERVDVFLGLNVAFDREVAIKELRGGVNTSDAERNAFYSDYEKWAKLGHLRLARTSRTRNLCYSEWQRKSGMLQQTTRWFGPPSLYILLQQRQGRNRLYLLTVERSHYYSVSDCGATQQAPYWAMVEYAPHRVRVSRVASKNTNIVPRDGSCFFWRERSLFQIRAKLFGIESTYKSY